MFSLFYMPDDFIKLATGPYRIRKPSEGESSNLFGSLEEAVPSSWPSSMVLNIFGPTEEPQNVPKVTNPPGGNEGVSLN
uniref:Uncharacterized protein n=1 Tax=Spermophilus dauricus TaxID=99837 RepID=A0A8C9PYH9_SPEDA